MVIHVHPNAPSDSGRAAAAAAMEADAYDRGLQGLVPLIHELLTRDLVHQSETGSFVLRDDVQQRLRELSEAPVASAPQVFIGRKCETCGLIRVTRLVNGLRMCGDCNGLLSAGSAPPVDDSAS
jgi:ribosomal protein L37AE/L43A